MTIGRLGVDGMGINTGKAAAATREQRHAVLPGPTLVLFVVIERLGMNETDINRGKAAAVTREQRYASLLILPSFSFVVPRSGELRTQKLKSHLVRTQSLNVLPLKPGASQYIAIHATLTARDFFLAYFYTSGPFTCIFSKTSPDFSLCWLWLTHGSSVGPQNKIGHPAGCRFPY